MEKFKLQWLHEKPPIKERKPNLFYYDIRNSEIDNGYQIERGVLVNNIGTTIGSHTGPGTVALFFFGKERVE